MFTPMVPLLVAFLASLTLVIIPDLFSAYNYPLSDTSEFWSSICAFLLPALVVVWATVSWHRAKLRTSMVPDLHALIETSLLEGRYDELNRVVTSNLSRIPPLTQGTEALLFSTRLVLEAAKSRTFLHLRHLLRLILPI